MLKKTKKKRVAAEGSKHAPVAKKMKDERAKEAPKKEIA